MSLEWIVVLFLLGILFLLVEVVVPGAVMGIIGGVLAIISVILALDHSFWVGLGMVVITISVAPLALYFGLRRLTLRKSLSVAEGFSAGAGKFDALIGKAGITTSPLHPSGMAQIDGQRVDVITDGELLACGVPIRVVRVEGNKIVVQAEDCASK